MEEFARGGCSVVCVDEEGSSVDETVAKLRARYGPRQLVQLGKEEDSRIATPRFSGYAYRCDLWDREQIKALAKRVKEDVGRVDVLVTCAGNPQDGLFDTVSRTLMSHYWVRTFIYLLS